MFQLLPKSGFPLTLLRTMLLRTMVFIFVAVNEPANGISSFVAVKKPGILTICIDPKDLNKALKRNHYYAKTLDDILPNLAKAKVFSVLDAKDGYHQIELDGESSYLTTFWSPKGRIY